MTISQRVFFLLEKQGKKQNELSKFTGISTSTISAWNKRGTNPAADTISTIADFFDVSTDYLLTGKENQATTLTNDEQELLENYNKLSIENQKKVSERAKELATQSTHKEQENRPTISKSGISKMNSYEKRLLNAFKTLSYEEQIELTARAEMMSE
ncbi:MAG: helix-turn-helix transcriptional regulator, partial [Ruminococcus sp.]|nr:helix-turn-helix transcriptional regulator [Ruminococcus sp.]